MLNNTAITGASLPIQWIEEIRSNVLLPVQHRFWTFSIPKRLRPYFKYNRKLLSLMVDAANFALTALLSGGRLVKNLRLGISEFGKKSPGLYRHGVYLDLVSTSIIWLPPNYKFVDVIKLSRLEVVRLDPTDVCVSKAFAYCKSSVFRSNDKSDIINALDEGLVNFKDLVLRLDETLPMYESHAEVPESLFKLFDLVKELADHCDSHLSLKYVVPEWMYNI